ncbi:hypothetical protein [Pseudoduganella buxea]|uniref:Uncharacterized protein n=1 Tax=Pseudoduganella buxea TaxID=1949069 RepID=A0A6I3T4J8_9BURK|nr:hypothetical protein [Pseudoduganella buxea]MTV55865.1 hypothetical protein [Pseudoduganella buxea]GGC24372.1 hypothetical protein GCM10011572_52370 [Pseudoduganella buxea]
MSSPTCAHPGALPDALSCTPPAPAQPSPARCADGADSTARAEATPAVPTVGQELRRLYANLVFLR